MVHLLFAVIALLIAASPALAGPPQPQLEGGEAERVAVCGAEHRARTAPAPATFTLSVDRTRRPYVAVAQHCEGGRWRTDTRHRLSSARPLQLVHEQPGDARVLVKRRGRAPLVARYHLHVTPAVESTPVAFPVRNVNRSALPCSSDGAEHTLRGRLIAPAGRPADTITLYLHEFSYGAWFWERNGFATALAERGHASVVIDRLGYGESPRPGGQSLCFGSQADMAHQVATQLRERHGARRVVLAGHSVGGGIAELAAVSFPGIDALALFGWADGGFAPDATRVAVDQGSACMQDDYAFYGTEQEFRAFQFHDADPAVVADAVARRAPDPCGDSHSQAQAIAINSSRAGDLQIPIFLAFGENDPVFQPDTPERQAQSYRSSPNVDLYRQPRAAHGMALERSTPLLVDAVDGWLSAQPQLSR
jgi:pimeloyl-ACP methyl ester carboxylesterase